MTRTIKQWFELVEDEALRAELIALMQYGDEQYADFQSALASSFYWHDSPQGWDYWQNVMDNPPQPSAMTRPKFIDIYAVAVEISRRRRRKTFIQTLKQIMKWD